MVEADFTIRWCCRTICRCRRTTARRAISPACGCRTSRSPQLTARRSISRSLPGRTVVYVYPRTGRPGQALPTGWDAIPGARGCTPQSCGFRDHFAELKRLGVAALYGLSTQDTAYQREAAERLHLPFAILSDAGLKLTRALRLPTFERRRHGADQAHGLGDRRRRRHPGVLSGVPARQERRRGRDWLQRLRAFSRRGACAPPQTPRGTSRASARRCWCCSASSDSSRTA